MRLIVASVVALGLAVGIWLLWPRTSEVPVPSTEAAGTTTTLDAISTTTSTTPPTTTTESMVVTTVEEAEEILRDLWFGWFEGIYNQDEDRIREVVVLEEAVEIAKDSFGIGFEREPSRDDIGFMETEILRSDSECVAAWAVMHLSGFREGSSGGVYVLRRVDQGWARLSTWVDRNDLWEDDCESSLASP